MNTQRHFGEIVSYLHLEYVLKEIEAIFKKKY